MIDPFVVLEIMAAIIITVFLGTILKFAFRFLFYALIFVLVMVFVFGVSYDQMVSWVLKTLLWAF